MICDINSIARLSFTTETMSVRKGAHVSVELDSLLSPEQVSAVLGVKVATLKVWRYRGRGPSFVRLSRKAVRYSEEAVKAFKKSLNKKGED